MLGAGLARSVDPAVTLDGVMGRARPMEGVSNASAGIGLADQLLEQHQTVGCFPEI